MVLLGSLCSSRPWLAVLFAGTVAAVASFVFLGLQVPPPREYLIVLAALAATGIPRGLTGALREGALVAGGAALASVVALTPTLGRRRTLPQTRALSQAWSALAGLLDTAATDAAGPARERALVAVGRAPRCGHAVVGGTEPARGGATCAARIGVVVAAGTGLGRILGLDHSYWVGLTAAAVLQANNVAFLLRRAVNRVADTIVGVDWPDSCS